MTLNEVREKINSEKICYSDYDFDYWEKSDFFLECFRAEQELKAQGFICEYCITDEKEFEIGIYFKEKQNKNLIGFCHSWHEIKTITRAVIFAKNY